MGSQLFWIGGGALVIALLAGVSARLPRSDRTKHENEHPGTSLPPEILRALEGGKATLTLSHAGEGAEFDRYPTTHQAAAAIRPQRGTERTTAVAMPSAGRKADDSSSIAAAGG